MRKTMSICLFFILIASGCYLSYNGGYYFGFQNQKKWIEQEKNTKNQEKKIQVTECTVEEADITIPAYEFILCQENGYVVVYYADGETLHSRTDIRLNTLSTKLQTEITMGKEIYSEAELYNFLENYSS